MIRNIYSGEEMTVLHEILDKHEKIAWDMDDSLIGGPNSDFFRDYITAHPEKTHHVITFRDLEWANEILEELENCGMDARKLILSVENCPEMTHHCYAMSGRLKNEIQIHHHCKDIGISYEEFVEHVKAFPHWKAKRAAELGCTLLVDDLEQLVRPGCEKHGIAFYHSHTPL
jgi:hypothetical protein